MFLHAHKLAFVHPMSGESLAFEAPLPRDLAAFVAQLDATGNANA